MGARGNLDSLLAMMAAPFSALFLVLAVCAFAPRQPAEGTHLILLSARPCPPCCVDGREEIVHWGPGQEVWINEERVGAEKAPARIAELMENRAERAIYLMPDREVPYQEVTELASRLQASVDGLYIGLVTRREMKKTESTINGETHYDLECLAWPASALQAGH